MRGWRRALAVVAAVVFSAVLAGPRHYSMNCVAFQSPDRLPAGKAFRAMLPGNLELRVDGDIRVGPASEPFEDYLWLVSPPLQTAPQRMIGEAYNVTAAQSVSMMPRELNFVVTRADYDRVWQLFNANAPAEEYVREIRRLRLGTLYLMVTDSSVRGPDVEWLSFWGEACVPRFDTEELTTKATKVPEIRSH